MKRTLLITALFCCVTAAEFAAHVQSASTSASPAAAFRIDAKAVWNPSPSVLSDIRKVCSAGDPSQQEGCFVDSMRSAGASAEAAEFVRKFASHGLAYVRAFRDTGRVSIAYIEYLFRANEMDGVLLVNGDPPLIDVDDCKFICEENLPKNADYGTLLQKYPNTNIFPGDRYQTDKPSESTPYDGGQVFIVEYLIQSGCHACARVGTLELLFKFDRNGKFVQASVQSVHMKGDGN